MALFQAYVPRKPSYMRKNAWADLTGTHACAVRVGEPDCV